MSNLIELTHAPSVEFIETLGDIVRDGDNMNPAKLIEDISRMIDGWLKEEHERELLATILPGREIHTLDLVD